MMFSINSWEILKIYDIIIHNSQGTHSTFNPVQYFSNFPHEQTKFSRSFKRIFDRTIEETYFSCQESKLDKKMTLGIQFFFLFGEVILFIIRIIAFNSDSRQPSIYVHTLHRQLVMNSFPMTTDSFTTIFFKFSQLVTQIRTI